MQMLKCNDCGATFGDDEIAVWKEDRGEFWGQPCLEKLCGCPYCFSGDFEELKEDGEDDDS